MNNQLGFNRSILVLLRESRHARRQVIPIGDKGPQTLAENIFDIIHAAFDYLPLAALVDRAVFVLHGGIGDGSWTIDQLRQVPRPLKAETNGMVENALWSDPVESDAQAKWGVHSNARDGGAGGIKTFGADVTQRFCQRNNVQMVVRSHQVAKFGYRVYHGGRLITVFSARNYDNRDENKGAMLLFATDAEGALRVHPKVSSQRAAGRRARR